MGVGVWVWGVHGVQGHLPPWGRRFRTTVHILHSSMIKKRKVQTEAERQEMIKGIRQRLGIKIPQNDTKVEPKKEEPKKDTKRARDGDDAGGSGGSGDANSGDTTGIQYVSKYGKWCGQVSNPLKKTKSGGKKKECTPCFATKEAAIEARAVLKARVDAEYETRAVDLASKDPSTQGLDRIPVPRGSEGMAEIPLHQAYWTIGQNTGQLPIRVVRVGKAWKQGCKKCPPNNASVAIGNGLGGKAEFCIPCGGGCIHGRQPGDCMACQHKYKGGTARLTIFCNENCGTLLDYKRQESHGGNGLCLDCEVRVNAEAVASGSAPPPKNERYETVVFKQLIPLIVDELGNKIPYEMQDDLKNMLGSNRNAGRNMGTGKCDTAHQRRPDILYLKRDDEAHIVAAVMIEVDEHSHGDRDPECEGGKIHDTFQCLLKLAQEEGKSRLAETRKGVVRTPQIFFLRFNPNACDAPGGNGGGKAKAVPIRLETRVQVLAKRVNELLNTPFETYHTRSDAGQCMKPQVELYYYHSKQGAGNMAFYEAHAEAFHYKGNSCPRSVV